MINTWRLRQSEYSWLRNSIGTGRLAKLDLSKEKRDQLMNGFLEMKAYPDVQPAIQALGAAGIRLGFLSNLTEAMMEANIKSAWLEGRFEQLLSTDRVQAYKPDREPIRCGSTPSGCQNRRSYSLPLAAGMPPGRKASATRLTGRTD